MMRRTSKISNAGGTSWMEDQGGCGQQILAASFRDSNGEGVGDLADSAIRVSRFCWLGFKAQGLERERFEMMAATRRVVTLAALVCVAGFAQRPPPNVELRHVEHIPNANNPEMFYWFIDDLETRPAAYTRDLATISEKGIFDLTFLTARKGVDFYDFDRMRPVFTDIVRHAKDKGIAVGLQILPKTEGIPEGQYQGMVVEKELSLDREGRAKYLARSEGVRTSAPPQRVLQFAGVSSHLLRAFAFKKSAEGEYQPGTVIDVTRTIHSTPIDALSVSLDIDLGEAMRDYTVYVMTVHQHQYPDMFGPWVSDSLSKALQQYGSVGFEGGALDEWKYMGVEQKQTFRGRLFSEGMATYFKQETGGDLSRALFDMRYSPTGSPQIRIAAINHYFEVLRQGPLGVERNFAAATTRIFGDKAFHGIHDTFHNALDNDEVWATGLNWWAVPRDYGQTDENTPMPTRLGIGLAHAKPVEYNQFYSKDPHKILEEAMGDARFNVRVHYHAMNDMQRWGVDLKDADLLAGITAVEEKVRLLNQFDPPRPAMNLLFLFGYPALTNWFPDATHRNRYDINGSLKAEEKVNEAWKAGYRCALAPSYLIDDGVITTDGHGGVLYGGIRFDSAVYLGLEFSKEKTLQMLENFTAHGGKLLLDGRARYDFEGNDIAPRLDRLATSAVGTTYNVDALRELQVPKLAVEDGAVYEDGSVVLTDLSSLTSAIPKAFHLVLAGHTYSGSYSGVFAIKVDRNGDLLKLAGGGLRELRRDDQTIVTITPPSDIVLTRQGTGTYRGLVVGEASVAMR